LSPSHHEGSLHAKTRDAPGARDDEPLGRRRIVKLLESEPDVEVVGTASDGTAAVEEIRRLRPDLVFLDVQMPRMTGLEVVREVGPREMPVTVFVTAYDEYALQAFDIAAVDCLVKPFRDDRFDEALRRARRLAEVESRERSLRRAARRERTLRHPRAAAEPGGEDRPRWVPADPPLDHRTTGSRGRAAAQRGKRLRGPAARRGPAPGGALATRRAGAAPRQNAVGRLPRAPGSSSSMRRWSALRAYGGALLVVSHDQELPEAIGVER
jgi:CheY-like chemotaxis protein